VAPVDYKTHPDWEHDVLRLTAGRGDREFAFAEAPAALAHMRSGAHFGKIVIRVGS
jgi:NADPH:quinone reductase-like Zn-dependent oxidoreductase